MALKDNDYKSDELKWSERPPRLQHRFLVLRKLGQGTYGKVQLALNKEKNQEVAIKTIKKAKIESEEDMLRIRREIHIMTSIRHPHIIHIYEVFETRQKIVIVMQYASGGELYDYLGCHQTLPEDEARRIFRQIASAIYYCHKNQICHRDLKLENILLDEEGNAQIADFGLSNIFDDKRRMNTFCGSPLYASPEIVKGTPYKGPEVDCWSLGVLLYTLIYGTMPFDGRNFKELVSQISEGRYEEPINKSNASPLIRRLLTPDISGRATITDVCKDSWVNQGYDVSLLQVAENMALAAGLQRERLNATKLCFETNAKNGRGISMFGKTNPQLEQMAGKNSCFAENENIVNTDKKYQPQKPTLYEQITNYDVRFVINKLISAVEASLLNSAIDKNARNLAQSAKEKVFLQLRPKNGETPTPEKVDSAYVIPIFEVTTVVPKLTQRTEKNKCYSEYREKHHPQNILNGLEGAENIKDKQLSIENNKSITGKNIVSNKVKSKVAEDTTDGGYLQKKSDFRNSRITSLDTSPPGKTLLSDTQKRFHSKIICKEADAQKNNIQCINSNEQENSPTHHLSPKTKRTHDSYLFGQKHSGPFVRTRTHVLSLARILSFNYEKILRNSFRRVADNRKKPPGKIIIPATFDPEFVQNTVKENKQIILFPTVSVSENKEKIEKKIEKIKKAALNMNLIRRSNSKNRLKIEKYLRSQAKKIQDLVCDEQRSVNASMEGLEGEELFKKVAETCFCMFGPRSTNALLQNQENEQQFCFLCPNSKDQNMEIQTQDSYMSADTKEGDIKGDNQLQMLSKIHHKWHCGLRNILKEREQNLVFGALTKSKSEIKFPSEYLNYVSTNNTSIKKHSVDKKVLSSYYTANNKCFLTVPVGVQMDDSEMGIHRSASDSLSRHLAKIAFENDLDENRETDHLVNENHFSYTPAELQSNVCSFNRTEQFMENKFSVNENYSIHNFKNSQNFRKEVSTKNEDSSQSYLDFRNNSFDENTSIARSNSIHSYLNSIQGNSNNDQLHIMKRLSSEPFLGHTNQMTDNLPWRKESIKEGQRNMFDNANSSSWEAALRNGVISEQQNGKSRELRRRNTLSCVRNMSNGERRIHPRNEQSDSSDFEEYLWNIYKEREILLTHEKNKSRFSSSPNLNQTPFEYKVNHRKKDSKSLDYLNGEDTVSGKFSSDDYGFHLPTSDLEFAGMNSSNLRKISKHPNHLKSIYERSSNRPNREKSTSAETMAQNDRSELIRKLKAERKLSVPHGISFEQNDARKSPFLSNFLNDLENREQFDKGKSNFIQRRYPRNIFSFGKRSKSDSSKSFLQLLSLKRIQEAEKELDRVERNDMTDIEEENSGSLLEALKTHGYKGVISQRFQGPESNSTDVFSVRYPGWLSMRNLRPDIPRLPNFMYSDNLPHFTADTYDLEDLENTRSYLNGFATPSLFEFQQDFKQKPQKQFLYDWLQTSQNEENPTSFKTERNAFFALENKNQSNENKICSEWGKENSRSLDDESTSESLETSEENHLNGIAPNDGDKIRDFAYDASEAGNHTKYDRTPLFSSSVNIDDEKEESVHDRIWRKSFYSRFNNSALSRKERSFFLDADLSSESRAGHVNNFYTPIKSPTTDKTELVNWDDSSKPFQSERIHASKKYESSFSKFSSSNLLKSKLSKAQIKRNLVEKSSASPETNSVKDCNSNIENEDSEPEH